MAIAPLALILLLTAVLDAQAEDYSLKTGDIPLLIVSPHGGSQVLEGAPERQRKTSLDPQFNRGKDLMTAELSQELWEAFPPGRKPSLLLAKVHRRYLDLNRPIEWATESSQGKEAYRKFHKALETELERLTQLHGWALLLDVHGQNSEPYDLLLGTVQGSTISSWSENLIWGPSGAMEALRGQGWRVSPGQAGQAIRLSGGYIVRNYADPPKVEAWQLEHGPTLRFEDQSRKLYVQILAFSLLERLNRRLRNSSKGE